MEDKSQSIASDRPAAELPKDTRLRLVRKFAQFREDREKIRRRMESYVVDYQLHEEGATRMYEMLEEQYSVDAPNLNHLVFREDGSALWSMRDVAIVLGRNVSNVHRNIGRMRDNPDWSRRLDRVSIVQESPGRGAATLFLPDVFDVIVDFFEERYLERVSRPRHGSPMSAEEERLLRSFWNELRANTDFYDLHEFYEADAKALADAVSAVAGGGTFSKVYQCLRIIVKRTFSVKIGAFFLALFALVYELSRRMPTFNVVAPVASLVVLALVVFMMLRRKWYTPWLADAGAFALMSCMLWILAFAASPDGPAARLLPSFVKLKGEETDAPLPTVYLDITSIDDERSRVHFSITPNRMAKEIFCRIGDEKEFKSTGFMPQTNAATGTPFPNMGLWARMKDQIRVEVKYVGTSGETHGPYAFDIDTERERENLIERHEGAGNVGLADLLRRRGRRLFDENRFRHPADERPTASEDPPKPTDFL